MSRFTTYAIREISSSFLLLIILLSSILWLGQGLRHIELLTSDNVSFTSYLSYILLLLPKILLLTIPICLFLSVLININRLRNDSELIILWSAGKSEFESLLTPILFFSLLIYFFTTILSVYVTPLSLNEIRHKIIDIRSSGIHSSILKEKKFISPADTLTIFIQERNGNEINGLLIHDIKNSESPQTYIAENGEFIDEDNRKILRLYNGNIQIFESNESKISEIEFETYDLNLTPYNKKESSHIYSDELFTSQIISNLDGKKTNEFNKYEKEQYAELHSRFANPLYIFSFALIPLVMLKFSKKPGDNLLIPIAAVSIIAFIFQIIQITISNLLIDKSGLVFITYILPTVFLSMSIILIYLDSLKIK
jgi:lipopolysaccharide export system permease protein